MFNTANRLLASLLIAAFCLTVAVAAARAQQAPGEQFAETSQLAAPRGTPPAQVRPPASAPAKELKPVAVPPSLFEQLQSLQADVEAMKARLQNAEEQIGTLQGGMSSLQNKLSEYLAKVSYTCKTLSVSRSGSGVEENCSPYRCRNIDGRCAPQSCANVDDCAPGFVCLPGSFKCGLP